MRSNHAAKLGAIHQRRTESERALRSTAAARSVQTPRPDQSDRSASVGSMRSARLVGTTVASMQTPNMSIWPRQRELGPVYGLGDRPVRMGSDDGGGR